MGLPCRIVPLLIILLPSQVFAITASPTPGNNITQTPTSAPACNPVPFGISTNFLPYRADANGDCTIDHGDLFEIALHWDGGVVSRGYRVDPDYLLQFQIGQQRYQRAFHPGDANLDGQIDNEDADFFFLYEDLGLTDCDCGNNTGFVWFPYTMDLNKDGNLNDLDKVLFDCVFAAGGTCTPIATGTATTTRTITRTPTETCTPTVTPTRTITPTRTPTRACVGVNFPDPNLEREIRLELNILEGEITTCMLEELTELTAVSKGISNMEGLEHAINLEELNLDDNQILSLSPVTSLIVLRDLRIENNLISDFGPVASLLLLERLEIGQNQISDLSPVAGLTNLFFLKITQAGLTDIEPLAGLTNLSVLLLSDTNVSDLSPLSSLVNLTRLNLIRTLITDLQPLIDNSGFGLGDRIDIRDNPNLSQNAICNQIPQLQARFVEVLFDQTVQCK